MALAGAGARAGSGPGCRLLSTGFMRAGHNIKFTGGKRKKSLWENSSAKLGKQNLPAAPKLLAGCNQRPGNPRRLRHLKNNAKFFQIPATLRKIAIGIR